MREAQRTATAALALLATLTLAACGAGSDSSDSSGGTSASQAATALANETQPDTDATVGVTYSYTPTQTDGGAFSIEGQPSWASFDATTGSVTGTPTDADVGQTAAITVSNRQNRVGPWSIRVRGRSGSTTTSGSGSTSSGTSTSSGSTTATNHAPTISGTPAMTVTAAQAYTFTPTAADADGNTLTFSISNKPSWASFSTSTGKLSGTPMSSQVGTFANVVISVSDGTASASLSAFTVAVQAAAASNSSGSTGSSGTTSSGSTTSAVTAVGNAGVAQGAVETKVCTTALSGSHITYNVGPGQTYTELDTVPFGALVAGDVVNIYARGSSYKARIGLRAQGTANDPVVINGVSDSACNKPVIDFNGARTASGTNAGNGANVFNGGNDAAETLGGIVIKRGPSSQDAYGVYEPKFIIIQGLQLQGAKTGASFTSIGGSTVAYPEFTACLWVQQSQDVKIRNNTITDCGLGIFTMAKDGALNEASVRIDLANNRVYGNGVANAYGEHGFYVQAASPVVEGNYIGANRATSQGSSYKSRSSGEVFRYNYVVCTALCMDFVQSEDNAQGIAAQSDYGTDYVYGNTIVSNGPPVVHYGGDNQGEQERNVTATFVPPIPYRKHLRFWNNTYTLTSSDYRLNVFRLSAKETEVDAWGNTFNLNFSGAGALSWLDVAGNLRLGPQNIINGPQPVNAQADDGASTSNYSVTSNTPIPSDPRIAQLN